MAADPRDTFLQLHTPTVMVPKFGELDPLKRNGHRFLAATDGLWLELRRPWLYLLHPVALSGVAMPYGELEQAAVYEFDEYALGRLTNAFKRDAIAAMPNECAAWGVWDESAQRLRYLPLRTLSASPGSVEYERPTLGDGLHLAVDLHSHPGMGAFFSAADDEDDAGEVKLAVVLGNLDAEYTAAARLCALGLFVDSE